MADNDVRYIDQNVTPLTFGPHVKDIGGGVRQSQVGISGLGYTASGITAVTGTFTSASQSASFTPLAGRAFKVTLRGTFTAPISIQLERQTDGTNWVPITAAGIQLGIWSAAASEQFQDDQVGVLHRLNCTVYTSGTVNYRMEQ